ncbi:la-related protein 7-like protein [Dinothrombium tinctorium]|uniref:La-related protein 7 n=1 Tax=Dinothrombium tinctorium TaxID=1965070 RepID=A0A443QXG5_9ACAR|nr:la-related protein 7-like protein [Dinothrombium tinctorium]
MKEKIEFYMSDANLRKDRYLKQLMNERGDDGSGTTYVPLIEFLKFNKIKALTDDVKDICIAMKSSKILELNEDETELRRSKPIDTRKDSDLCTIYVERLPPNADREWIQSIFSQFGNIDYISLPYFKHNNKIKGFAFIEFESPQSVIKVCKRFSANIPSQLIDEKPETNSLKTNGATKHELESDSEENKPSKKLKTTDQPEDETSESDVKNAKNKTKKKNRRKNKNKTVLESEELELNDLRVMSKHEWNEYKQKYLKLQKEAMTNIKKAISAETIKTSFHNESSQDSMDIVNKTKQKLDIASGTIMKITFTIKPNEDFIDSIFKAKLRDICGDTIAYIDLNQENVQIDGDDKRSNTCYVRFRNKEAVDEMLNNKQLQEMGHLRALSKEEEEKYWERIKDCVSKKKQNKNKKKQRGCEKAIARAERIFSAPSAVKLNTHIKFE